MKKPGTEQLYLNLTQETKRYLQEYAKSSGKTMATLGAQIVEAYFAERREIAETILPIGKKIEEVPPLIHGLIDGAEQRVTATINNLSPHFLTLQQELKDIKAMLIAKALLEGAEHVNKWRQTIEELRRG